jgi:Flp pilus assembly protein TadD
MRNADYKDGIRLFTDVAVKSPLKERAYTNLGRAFLLAGRLDEAATNFERAVSLKPGSAQQLANLAYVYNLKGWKSESKALLERALALDPTNVLARVNLATQYFEMGQIESAARECRIIIELRPVGKQADFARSMLTMIDSRQ